MSDSYQAKRKQKLTQLDEGPTVMQEVDDQCWFN